MGESVTIAEVKDVVDINLPYLKRDMALQQWMTVCDYFESEEGEYGPKMSVDIYASHCQAHLKIDAAMFDDKDDVFTCLKHELLHLHLGPLELAFATAKDLGVEIPGAVRFYAVEQSILSLERMLEAQG